MKIEIRLRGHNDGRLQVMRGEVLIMHNVEWKGIAGAFLEAEEKTEASLKSCPEDLEKTGTGADPDMTSKKGKERQKVPVPRTTPRHRTGQRIKCHTGGIKTRDRSKKTEPAHAPVLDRRLQPYAWPSPDNMIGLTGFGCGSIRGHSSGKLAVKS